MSDAVVSSLLIRLEEYHAYLRVAHEDAADIDPDVADLLADIIDEIYAFIEVLDAIENGSDRWGDTRPATHSR